MPNKKDKRPRNDKGQAHGNWVIHFSDGKLYYSGNFINNQLFGYWFENDYIKKLIYKEYYAR